MLDQIVANFLAGRRVADDELFAGQVRPFQFRTFAKQMSIRQHDKHALGPEKLGFSLAEWIVPVMNARSS